LEGEQRRAGTYKEPLTEEEHEARWQAAWKQFIKATERRRHENP